MMVRKSNKLIFIFLGILIALITTLALFFNLSKKDSNTKKLTFWSIQLKPVYEDELNKIISDFEKKHNLKITWIDIPMQEAQKRTLASILSSNPPDLINLNPDFSILLAQRNALQTFSKKDLPDFSENALNKLKYNDKFYAIPFYVTSPVTIYNKELYSKCIGGEFIKTYNDLAKIAPKLAKCEKDKKVFVAPLNENDNLAKILNKYDITNLKSQNNKNKTAEIFSQFNSLYKNNYMPVDMLTINHREVVEKYMTNQILTIVAGSNFISMIEKSAPDMYKNSEISEQLIGDNKKYDIALMNLIIPKKSNNKELALEFAKILTNKENQLKLAKLTNVLPVNKYALEDDYFKNCSSKLSDKARCISVKQLNNSIIKDFGEDNKKYINENINRTFEKILLDENSNLNSIKKDVEKLSKEISVN